MTLTAELYVVKKKQFLLLERHAQPAIKDTFQTEKEKTMGPE